MKCADLHVHTHFSDGTFTPKEVVRVACERGLSAIAICDHDCVDGIDPAMECAKSTSLEIIPGVELTVIDENKEIHMLGYFISWKEKWFQELLKKVQRERIGRVHKMIEKLKACNITIDVGRVMQIDGRRGSVGRLHLARALAQTGAVSSVKEAFNKYIGDNKPCYVEDIGFSPKEAIDIIVKAKGVPVLAHPKTIGDNTLVQRIIKSGIRGIEVYHTDQKSSDSKKYEKIAKDYGLLATGGSDCHGLGKQKILMGSVKIPYSTVQELRKLVPSE
ncbi:MAG: PHP domain-containing protein [Candidatus Omnitrophica bacterium]|nr:PHP domain-containing protein [Candidatus Omnitrophota bacterium]